MISIGLFDRRALRFLASLDTRPPRKTADQICVDLRFVGADIAASAWVFNL